MERRKTDYFGWIATFILTVVVSYVGYTVTRELHHIDSRFDINDTAHEKMWNILTSYQVRINCLDVKVAQCCKGEPTCM